MFNHRPYNCLQQKCLWIALILDTVELKMASLHFYQLGYPLLTIDCNGRDSRPDIYKYLQWQSMMKIKLNHNKQHWEHLIGLSGYRHIGQAEHLHWCLSNSFPKKIEYPTVIWSLWNRRNSQCWGNEEKVELLVTSAAWNIPFWINNHLHLGIPWKNADWYGHV